MHGLSAALAIGLSLAAVKGTVRAPDGTPVPGTFVCALPDPLTEEVREPSATARTDATGAFTLELPAGTYMVSATAPGLAGAVARKVQENASAVALELTKSGRTLSGRVTAPDGKAAAKAWVFAIDPRGPTDPAVLVVPAGEDGRFSLTVPRAPYVLAATSGSLTSALAHPKDEDDATVDLQLQQEAAGAVPAAVTQWIKQAALPLTAVTAGSGFADLAPLGKTIGSARVVALGEATHGTREFFQLKHRMLEFLVEKMGFTVFAIEASLPDALFVDDYVTQGTGEPAQALAGLGFWTWDTQEVLEMIRWMRRYNENPNHARKLRFYGFDMQAPWATADRLAAYLKKVGPETDVPKLIDPLAPLLRRTTSDAPSEAERSQVTQATQAIEARLKEKKADYLAASNPVDYALALRLVELLHQAAEVVMKRSPLARDRAMAENVLWILDQQPGARMALWAHNGHITIDEQVMAGGSMGVHLRKALGPDYLTFGFAFDHGAFQAIEREKGLQAMTVGPAKEESLDAALATAGPDLLALDLRKVPKTGPVADWFAVPRPARSIGAMFDPAQEKSFYTAQSPPRAYDALLFVKSTTSAIPASSSASPSGKPRDIPPPRASAANLDFEADTLDPWSSKTERGGYRVSLDATTPAEGKRCARIDREGERTASKPFGNVMQRISAVPYRGKKVRFTASVRAEVSGAHNQAQLWLRVDREKDQRGFFDNMQDRPIRDPEWKAYSIVGDVAPDAESLNFGMFLLGEGRAWVDAVKIEVVEAE
jgi:erythromycin esterase